MSSANSIIRYYQNESAANSSRELPSGASFQAKGSGKGSELGDIGSSETLGSPPKTITSSFIFPKVDQLPTPLESGKSAISNFFTLPLRLFKGKRGPPHDSNEGEVLTSAELKEQTAPIDIISDSPVEMQSPVEADLESDGYDNYIRYIYQGDQGSGASEEKEAVLIQEPHTLLVDDEPVFHVDSATVVNAEGVIDQTPQRSSTLNRIKNKTRYFLRTLPIHRDNIAGSTNIGLQQTEKTNQRFITSTHLHRADLKRKFSSVGSRSDSWKRFKASTTGRGKSLLDLFQSEDFEKRLKDGDVSSRRESFDDDENYHIDFKVNMNTFQPPVLTSQRPNLNSFRVLQRKSIDKLRNSMSMRRERASASNNTNNTEN